MTVDEKPSDPFWPFATQEQHAAYLEQQAKGYAMLSKAHEAFMAALVERNK